MRAIDPDTCVSKSKWIVKGVGRDLWWFLEVKNLGVLSIRTSSSIEDAKGALQLEELAILESTQANIFTLP